MTNKRNLISKLESIDWDFPGDRCSSAFSTTHWHPCRFVSQIPTALIGLLSKEGDHLLDPFCGSGTTAVESQRLGRCATGIDINPVSILIARAKCVAMPADAIESSLDRYWKTLIQEASNGLTSKEIYEIIPESVQAEKWYHPKTLEGLAIIWRFLQNRRGAMLPILQAAFSSILQQACNENRHWGYICDNTNPVSIKVVDALKLYGMALNAFKEAYALRDMYLTPEPEHSPIEEVILLHQDAKQAMKQMADGSIDLVITSPPYFGVCDYVKAQRLSMEWFGWNISEFRQLEIGARSKRHRRTADHDYVSELNEVLFAMNKVLKRGGHAAFVFGESKSRASVLEQFRNGLNNHFSLIFETCRTVPAQRRQHPSLSEEWVFVAKK